MKDAGMLFVSGSTFAENEGTTTGGILVELGSTATIEVTLLY